MWKLFKLAIFILAVALVSLGAVFVLHRPSNTVIASWWQPDNIHYSSGRYFLSVIELDFDWTRLPFHFQRNYQLYLGVDKTNAAYGHTVHWNFRPDQATDQRTYIKRSSVLWTPDGVFFTDASGQQVFVPKHLFIQGS